MDKEDWLRTAENLADHAPRDPVRLLLLAMLALECARGIPKDFWQAYLTINGGH